MGGKGWVGHKFKLEAWLQSVSFVECFASVEFAV